jgi:tripartite-type tricarboxylate transporter receptor subunit TctC
MSRLYISAAGIAAAAMAACCHYAVAQADRYPTKAVRVIVPVPPGGGTDFLARLTGQKLTERLGQAFIVDNRGGASGAIASVAAAKAAPDGYTLYFGYTAPLGTSPALTKVPYDPVADYVHISLIATATNALVVYPGLPVKSVRELIDFGKSRPSELRYASAGVGTAPHMSAEIFEYMTGIKMVHVPYKGNGPALVDLLAGHVQLSFPGLPPVIPHWKAGRVRVLAVTGLKRSSQAPDIPTIDESGLQGFNTDQWYGLLAPLQTPQPIVAKLYDELMVVTKSSDYVERAQAQGFEIVATTGSEFREHIRSEIAKWTKLVKDVGIRAE